MTPFDASRQHFLAAFRAMLADRALTEAERASEAWVTVAAVSREILRAEVGR